MKFNSAGEAFSHGVWLTWIPTSIGSLPKEVLALKVGSLAPQGLTDYRGCSIGDQFQWVVSKIETGRDHVSVFLQCSCNGWKRAAGANAKSRKSTRGGAGVNEASRALAADR